jgi:hypothetical protein
LQPLFQSAQHFHEKREGSGAGSASGSILVTLRKTGLKMREKMCARHAYARGPGRLITLAVQGDHVTGDPLLSTMPAERESKLAKREMEVAKL